MKELEDFGRKRRLLLGSIKGKRKFNEARGQMLELHPKWEAGLPEDICSFAMRMEHGQPLI